MKITVEDNYISISKYIKFKLDGSDLTEQKLLELFEKITIKEDVEIDEQIEGDNRTKCELIKTILETYINNYFCE